MYKILLSVSLLLAPVVLSAQTAADFFHRGAQLYIWNKKPEAKAEILAGLKLFPEDPLLNGMAALLQKEEEQQKNQQQQSQQNQQDQQQQQNQPQQNQQSAQNRQDQQSQSQPQSSQAQQQQAQEKPQQNQQSQQAQAASPEKDKNDEQQRQGAAYAPGQMTPEQARQLLDAEKGEEKMLPLRPEGKPAERTRPVKDW